MKTVLVHVQMCIARGEHKKKRIATRNYPEEFWFKCSTEIDETQN